MKNWDSVQKPAWENKCHTGTSLEQCPFQGNQPKLLSRPDSRLDPFGGSEPSSGCENIYWDSLPA